MSYARSETAEHDRPRSYYHFGADRFFLGGIALTLLSYTLEGPVRYALQLAHIETLLYARDAFALLCVMLATGSWIAGQASASVVVAAVCLLLAHTVVALLTLAPFQALFGFKIYLTYLLGFVAAPLLQARPRTIVRFAAAVFGATVVGVCLNHFSEFPWIGGEYETAFGATSVAKQWWVEGGKLRLPGFARASYDAAAFAVLALVPLIAAPTRVRYKVILVLAAAGTVLMTTSKAPLLALPMMLVELALAQGIGPVAASFYLFVLGAAALAVPLIAVQLNVGGAGLPSILDSFMERVLQMWPDAFALYDHPGQLVWGRGLGGIGTAQAFGELPKLNAGDNVMVFLLVSCGVLGPLYVAAVLLKLHDLLQARPKDDYLARCAGAWMALWLATGITTNMIEEAGMNFVIGLVSGLAFVARKPVARSAPAVSATALSPVRRTALAGRTR